MMIVTVLFTSNFLWDFVFKKDLIIKTKTSVWWEDPTPGKGEWSYITMENGGMFHYSGLDTIIVDTKSLLM